MVIITCQYILSIALIIIIIIFFYLFFISGSRPYMIRHSKTYIDKNNNKYTDKNNHTRGKLVYKISLQCFRRWELSYVTPATLVTI